MSTIAQRIRDIRYKKGLGPDALAARAEISRTALYQIECGKTEVPRAGTLRRIAQALEVPVDQLLGYSAPVPSAEPPAPFQPRPMTETSRVGLKAESDWAYPEDAEVNGYSEAKRSFIAVDHREDLVGMLEELLDTRYGDSIVQIIQETHRLMSLSRSSSLSSNRPYADIRYRTSR